MSVELVSMIMNTSQYAIETGCTTVITHSIVHDGKVTYFKNEMVAKGVRFETEFHEVSDCFEDFAIKHHQSLLNEIEKNEKRGTKQNDAEN